MPWMAAMLDRYGEQGLVVVAVNLDEDPASAERFLAGTDYGFEQIQDAEGRLAEEYGLAVMPSSILFDRTGRPVYRHEGFHEGKRGVYERHIVELLEGRGPSVEIPLGDPAARNRGVRPWQRGLLATPEMQLISDPLETDFDEHVYFSKEASSGGRGFGGGGCGCN
jgi:hypothetical protein